MIDPYTMERLNAERLKDIDREAAGLSYSRLARRNRRRIFTAARRRLAWLLITAGKRAESSVEEKTRRLSDPAQND